MTSNLRPTVTVIIPAFNAAAYLGKALESLIRQTSPATEIMVVDDGSTDETSQVIEAYRGAVTSFRQQNAGDGAARNAGLLRATGQYVAFLDADDLCAPERLERQALLLQQNPEAVACFTGHWTFDDSGRRTEFALADAGPQKDQQALDSLDVLARCLFMGPSVMFDRVRTQGVRFPEDVRSAGGDIIFSALLATRGRVVAVPAPLYGYRLHSGQKSVKNRATTQSNRFFEYRYHWAKDHWAEHWPDRSWEEVERKLWAGLVAQTEDAYWARHKRFFVNDRNYLRQNWPPHLPVPSVVRWRWYPTWLRQAKDYFDLLTQAKS